MARVLRDMNTLGRTSESYPSDLRPPPPNARFAPESIGDSDVHLGEAGGGRFAARLEWSLADAACSPQYEYAWL